MLVASSTTGVVQVYLVNYLLETISNSVSFEYIDPNKAKEDFVEKDIKNPDDFQEMLILLSRKMGKMNLNSTEAKETNPPGKHDQIVELIRGISLEISCKICGAFFLK